ncbi:DUF2189 domain-containing protein [Chlorobium ferrooxidans]|uniref:hypothetical protein n=1 Tax=Chlorobium ferrooxidans TaxID=84205 RepID=UPI00030E7EDD|nr:hypothetical protein [Chlorobium ferrooxidans]
MNDINKNVCILENRVIQNPDNGKRVIMSSVLLLCSVILFLLSLLFDCVYLEGEKPLTPGWSLLMTGWLGIIYGYISWLANPIVFVGWIVLLKKDFELGLLFSICALLVMLSVLFYKSIITSEYPAYSRIIGYGVGYWLWVSSAGILAAASVCGLKKTIDESALNIDDKSCIRVVDGYHFDLFELLKKGYKIFSKNIYEYLVFSLIVFIVIASTVYLYYLNKSNELILILLVIVYMFVLSPLFAGYFVSAFSDISGKRFQWINFFKGFDFLIPLLLVNLLVMFVVFMFCVLFFMPVYFVGVFILDGLIGIKGGSVNTIIVLVFSFLCSLVIMTYLFSFPLMLNCRVCFWDALVISGRVYFKYYFPLIGFIILLVVINLIGLIFFGVGLLVTMPVTLNAFAVVYQSLIAVNKVPEESGEFGANL